MWTNFHVSMHFFLFAFRWEYQTKASEEEIFYSPMSLRKWFLFAWRRPCPICLGTVHRRRALTKPETCVFLPAFNTRKTSDVCGKGPEKTDVEQHDLLLVRSVHSMNPRLVGLTIWSMLMLVVEVVKSLANYSLSCFTIQARSCG